MSSIQATPAQASILEHAAAQNMGKVSAEVKTDAQTDKTTLSLKFRMNDGTTRTVLIISENSGSKAADAIKGRLDMMTALINKNGTTWEKFIANPAKSKIKNHFDGLSTQFNASEEGKRSSVTARTLHELKNAIIGTGKELKSALLPSSSERDFSSRIKAEKRSSAPLSSGIQGPAAPQTKDVSSATIDFDSDDNPLEEMSFDAVEFDNDDNPLDTESTVDAPSKEEIPSESVAVDSNDAPITETSAAADAAPPASSEEPKASAPPKSVADEKLYNFDAANKASESENVPKEDLRQALASVSSQTKTGVVPQEAAKEILGKLERHVSASQDPLVRALYSSALKSAEAAPSAEELSKKTLSLKFLAETIGKGHAKIADTMIVAHRNDNDSKNLMATIVDLYKKEGTTQEVKSNLSSFAIKYLEVGASIPTNAEEKATLRGELTELAKAMPETNIMGGTQARAKLEELIDKKLNSTVKSAEKEAVSEEAFNASRTLLQNLSSTDFASALQQVFEDAYLDMNPSELDNKKFDKPETAYSELANLYNALASYVQDEVILKSGGPKESLASFGKFLKIADAASEKNNFLGGYAVYSGLAVSGVERTIAPNPERGKKDLLQSSQRRVFDKLGELFSPLSSWKGMRATEASALASQKPVIPITSMLGGDTTFAIDGNEGGKQEGIVNISGLGIVEGIKKRVTTSQASLRESKSEPNEAGNALKTVLNYYKNEDPTTTANRDKVIFAKSKELRP